MLVRRVTPDFDMSFGSGQACYAKNAEAVAQNMTTRLQLLLTEWFLDTGAGVPYLRDIMVRPSNLPLAESLIKRTISETTGVTSITFFRMTLNHETRRCEIQAAVKTVYGEIASIKVTQ